jgi:hypothetical protein
MDSLSILDQIINTQKAEEVAKLNVVEIVKNLFTELSDREKDILIRRFGLHGNGFETLENIGQAHGLTRERIRQIESASIKRLSKLDRLESYVETLKHVINQLLEEHGGFIEKDYLLDLLITFSVDSEGGKIIDKSREIHNNHLDFLISKLLNNKFEEKTNSDYYRKLFKIKFQDLAHYDELAAELLSKVSSEKKLYRTEELISIITGELESFVKHKEKLERNYAVDISRVLANDWFSENAEVVNNNKTLYSLLRALKDLDQNKFGHWGLREWKEISPKTINDKIFLVLKNHGKPLHFVEIANQINNVKFDGKKANPATVHNELILDDKYVLIGRGIYGLKEWGYNKGTVADVIKEILIESGEPLTRDEILQKVLQKRMVKETTVVLALMNKEMFEKIGNRYKALV